MKRERPPARLPSPTASPGSDRFRRLLPDPQLHRRSRQRPGRFKSHQHPIRSRRSRRNRHARQIRRHHQRRPQSHALRVDCRRGAGRDGRCVDSGVFRITALKIIGSCGRRCFFCYIPAARRLFRFVQIKKGSQLIHHWRGGCLVIVYLKSINVILGCFAFLYDISTLPLLFHIPRMYVYGFTSNLD